jgi:hypothetical protein
MHEDEIRALVREAVARHLGAATLGPAGTAAPALDHSGRAGSPSPAIADALALRAHLSHGRFVFLAPTDPDAPCIVEPQVRCHHCGFCQSYGH